MSLQIFGTALIFIGVVAILIGSDLRSGDLAAKSALCDSKQRIIQSMDRTMRSQWEVQRILYRRLGEESPPPPVSITGLPDPKP